MKLPRKSRLIILISGIFGIVLSIALLAMNQQVAGKYQDRIFSIDAVTEHQVGLVLGSQVWAGGQVSDILADRLETGIELYKLGKIRKLILSGDHGDSNYDEVNAMKLFIVRKGVPADDVFMDHAGFRTYDSCYRARDVFGVRSMTIITNGFHLPRALYIANTLGIDAVGVASDRRRYRTENYNNLREFAARCKAYVDINILKLKPKYLGPRIDIAGSGLTTQD